MQEAEALPYGGRDYQAGDVLFREGEDGTHLYIIQQGAVRLVKEIEGQQLTLAELGQGEFAGETGVVCNSKHTATAIAIGPTRCLLVDSPTLETMITSSAEIGVRFVTSLAERLAQTQQLLTVGGAAQGETLGEAQAEAQGEAQGEAQAEAPQDVEQTPINRVCSAIVKHAEESEEQDDQGVWVRRRLGDIGQEVGVSEQELGEISKHLMRSRLIRIKRDAVLVPDVARMYEFIKSNKL